jgi:hypothetical protein
VIFWDVDERGHLLRDGELVGHLNDAGPDLAGAIEELVETVRTLSELLEKARS